MDQYLAMKKSHVSSKIDPRMINNNRVDETILYDTFLNVAYW